MVFVFSRARVLSVRMSSFVQSRRFTVFFAIYVLPCNQTCGPISGAYVNKNFSRSRQYGLAAHTERSGWNVVDDRHGFRPAGTEEWVRNGFLDADTILPLSPLERQACYVMFSEPAVICQNIFLATEALGIGGWMHCGFLSREIFEVVGPPCRVEGCVGLWLPQPVASRC